MFRGVGKFVAVAVIAAIVGAGIGVALAALTDSGDAPTASAPTTAPAPATQTQATTPPAAPPPPPARTQPQTQTQTTAAPTRFVGPVPKVRFASATISTPDADGRAVVTAKVTVTNRYSKALALKTPTLISGSDKVPLDSRARTAAAPLLGTLDPGASATGELRFTLPAAITRRLSAAPSAKLRIAGRTVALELTPTG